MTRLVQIALTFAAIVFGVIAYRVQVDDLFSPSNRALAIGSSRGRSSRRASSPGRDARTTASGR